MANERRHAAAGSAAPFSPASLTAGFFHIGVRRAARHGEKQSPTFCGYDNAPSADQAVMARDADWAPPRVSQLHDGI